MILTALRFRGPSDKEFRTWRFTSGVGAFRNFISFHVSGEALADVVGALDYALTGQNSPRVAEVAVQISDSGGESWIIQRAGKQVRYLRNNQPVQAAQAQVSLLASLLDFVVDGAEAGLNTPTKSLAKETPGASRVRAIHSTARGIVALPWTDSPSEATTPFVGSALDEVDKSVAMYTEECATLFNEPKFRKPLFTAKMGMQLRLISEKYAEYRDQLRDLTAIDKSISPDIQKRIDQLAPELDLLSQMEETSAPLLDPGQTPQHIKDSLERIESELTENLAVFGLDSVPTGNRVRDWRKPLDALCRYQTLKQLLSVSELAVRTVRQKMEPAWNEYFTLLENSVSKDLELTCELESCVTSLQVRTREADRLNNESKTGNRTSKSRFGSGWFEKFKSDSTTNSAPDDRDPTSTQSRLDSARMALDLSVSRLGVLRAQLEHLRVEHSGSHSEILDSHERLVADFGRAKDRWLAFANEHKLPEDMQVSSLTVLVTRYSSLFALAEERESLKNKIRDRKSRLARLEALLISWRQHTGSQRIVDLANSQILLAEARSILRYRQEKQDQFKKLLASAETNRNSLAIKAHLDMRRTKLLSDWRKAFSDTGITPVRLGDERLSTLFEHATVLQGLMTLDANLAKELPVSIFDGAPEGLPICLYVWDEAKTTTQQRELLLKQIEKASSPQFNIIVVTDESLADGLGGRGLGRAMVVDGSRPVRLHTSPIIQSTPLAAAAPKPLMSGRARAALDILTSKRL